MNSEFEIDPEQIEWACPDPAWDYADVWHQIEKCRFDLNALLEIVADQDNGSDEVDAYIRQEVAKAAARLLWLKDLIPPAKR